MSKLHYESHRGEWWRGLNIQQGGARGGNYPSPLNASKLCILLFMEGSVHDALVQLQSCHISKECEYLLMLG